ncbi:unnamed protein product [Heligmosomoides polygyrus]|uniref:Uncharacterized protein n=1 Tax=Heligmosomoides polygyrus TaxID=6339 RepID=A0A183F782_HELPZ|nr:unnamed protein product [Heligmosomoides polygyrus]
MREGSSIDFSRAVTDSHNCRRNLEEGCRNENETKREAARLELGITVPGRRKIEKQSWLCTDEVKEKVREKKRLCHAFLSDKTAEKWCLYQEAKKSAKRAVAVARVTHYDDVN